MGLHQAGVQSLTVLGPISLNVFISDFHQWKYTKSKFVNNTKLKGVVDFLGSREALEKDLDKMGRWTMTNCRKFKKTWCWILHIFGDMVSPNMCTDRGERLEGNTAERDLGILDDSKLNSWVYSVLWQSKRPTVSWGTSGRASQLSQLWRGLSCPALAQPYQNWDKRGFYLYISPLFLIQ